MALLWSTVRQIQPNLLRKFPGKSIDSTLNSFACTAKDEYRVEGEMMMALPPFVAKFSPDLCNGFLLGVADEDGYIQLLNVTKTGSDAVVKGWSAHSNAVFDIAWVNKDSKLITASGDQTARLWDIKKSETIGIFRGHTCSVKSVNIQPHSSHVFATGARDGNVMLWDTRCCMKNGYFGPVTAIYGAHRVDIKHGPASVSRKRKPRRLSALQQDSQQSVTSVLFQDDHHIFTAGACDGLIKLWDIRKPQSSHRSNPQPSYSIPYPGVGVRRHGYSCLVFDSCHSRLFASCTNDVIYMFETTTIMDTPAATYTGHQASTFYIKSALSPDDRYLISGSGDSNAYIWSVDHPDNSPWLLRGHCGEVTSVAWCQNDIGKIATCSDDNTFRIWRSKDHFHPVEKEQQPLLGSCHQQTRVVESRVPENSASCARRLYCDNCRRRRYRFATNLKVFHSYKTCTSCRTKPAKVQDEKEGKEQHLDAVDQDLSCSSATPVAQHSLQPKTPDTPDTPDTPKDSKSLMETWLRSPNLRKARDITLVSTECVCSPSGRSSGCTTVSPLSDHNESTSPKEEKRSILVALKSPKESDLVKSRKRPRTASLAPNLRYAAKRKRVSEKENKPNKVQKVLSSFTNNRLHQSSHSDHDNSSKTPAISSLPKTSEQSEDSRNEAT